MILLTIDEIVKLHEKMIVSTGGLGGIRDIGLLESAVFGAQAFYGEQEVYPTAHEKAACLAFSIIKNHPFVDANKRTGIFVILVTLHLNFIFIKFTQQELISVGLGIADGSIGYNSILLWIQNHEC